MLKSEERAILDFERAWFLEPGPKDQAIEFSLGLSAHVYYERLLMLLRNPSAFEYDPLTIKRVASIIESHVGEELAV
ncbi:MAG: DUF3263 domain-containing protein [Acidimicrobiia bacterium]